jgi:hypothetical protein
MNLSLHVSRRLVHCDIAMPKRSIFSIKNHQDPCIATNGVVKTSLAGAGVVSGEAESPAIATDWVGKMALAGVFLFARSLIKFPLKRD